MAKISKEEYYALKSLEDQWEWIARDSSGNHGGNLFAYSEKPAKDYGVGVGFLGRGIHSIDNRFFQFIQWEDSEPCSISELIEEYESEETEVKSKKELIEKWELAIESAEFYRKGKEEELISYMKDFVSDLKQLDEPEVLSREWIDENAHAVAYDGMPDETEIVYVDELQNLLVPKQEEIGVPQWFAEWFEGRGYEMSLYGVFNDLYTNNKSKMEEWSKQYEMGHAELQNDIASINFHGKGIYEVEEEPKYYVSVRDEEYGGFWFLSKNNNGDISIGVNRDWSEVDWDRLKLTEQEIKDYDERYWPFAVKAEEMENDDN